MGGIRAPVRLGSTPSGDLAGIVRTSAPNRTRSFAAATPQLNQVRAGLVPGNAPLFASNLQPPREVVTTSLTVPREPDMSLLGRIGGALKGAVTGFVAGGPGGALGGAALGAISSGGARRPTVGSQVMTSSFGSSNSGSCPPGTVRFPPFVGPCINPPGGDVTGGGPTLSYGEAVSARYGAALVPASRSITVSRCPRGAVLGNDGYCYNKSQLNRKDRKWVPGRKPLLTGGDLNAITRANRAANRIRSQQKRLQEMGMLPKPKAAPRRQKTVQQLAPGITVVDT